jgi:alpha-galactosidase
MNYLNKIYVFVIMVSAILSQVSCKSKQNKNLTGKVYFSDSIALKNERIEVRFNKNMYCQFFYNNMSLNDVDPSTEKSYPTHFIEINDSVIKDFKLVPGASEHQDIKTEFGSGKQLVLEGNAIISGDIKIRKKLFIELYDKYPSTVIIYAEYKNLSDKKVGLAESFSNYLRLDASMVNETNFHAFKGTGGRPAKQLYTPIPDNLNEENYIGRSEKFEKIKQGYGGLPITDIWCAKMGIGIGHIEQVWQNLFMPVKVDEDKKTVISILEKPGLNLLKPFILDPNQEFKTVKAFINLHELDFYNTARVYSELMNDQNISFKTTYTPTDYAVSWCSWNDFATTGMASKYDIMIKKAVLNRVKELNPALIQQIIFDAGWFNNQGDWGPNTDSLSFPGGEEDLISTIKSIHESGFKVMLWLSFLTADPWSEVAKKHPGWMITKPDGGFYYDRWSGYTMCPGLPEVQKYHQQLAGRLVKKYKADAFKIDGMYTCPPCYNPKHNHKDPNESSADFYKVFKSFYDEAKRLNPESTVMVCPCGSINSFAILPYLSQTIGADPELPVTVRQMSKLYKALKGSNSPYSSDDTNYNKDEAIRIPNAVGVGAVPQFLYGPPVTEEQKIFHENWLKIYHQEKLYNSEYLNLYDMYYDKPETYVFKKTLGDKEIIYYSFFAENSHFEGKIQLRGLKTNQVYNIIDYPNEKNLGKIRGRKPSLKANFDNYLFIKCIPE